MKRRGPIGVGCVAVLAVCLVLPAAAGGAEEMRPRETGFALQASNGYKFVAFGAAPPGSEEGDIGIYLERGRGSVFYTVPARVTSRTIDANLGELGRISVTRVQTGQVKRVRTGCKRRRWRWVEAQRYEGTIEFNGEEEFAKVSATAAPLVYPTICFGKGTDGGRRPNRTLPGARLDVDKRRRERYRLELTAVQGRPGGRTGVKVEVTEYRGKIQINRWTWTVAGAFALRYDRLLSTATIKPPAPFAGHATFRRAAPPAMRWRGNLIVDLPGRSDVPLTGRGFWANLEHPRH